MSNKDRGVYSPSSDEYDRFDVSEEDDSRRGPLLLVVAIAVVIAMIAVVYTAYHQGVRTGGRGAAPLIVAPSEPIKVAPEPAAQQVAPPPQNSAYDPLDGANAGQKIVVAPPPEQPAPRPIAPVAQQPKPAPAPKPVVQPTPAPLFDYGVQTDGKFVVQLGAFRSKEQALQTWAALRTRLPILTEQTIADVQRADLGAKGVYFRLRAAAFASRAAGNAFCTALKSKGQDCIVVAR